MSVQFYMPLSPIIISQVCMLAPASSMTIRWQLKDQVRDFIYRRRQVIVHINDLWPSLFLRQFVEVFDLLFFLLTHIKNLYLLTFLDIFCNK